MPLVKFAPAPPSSGHKPNPVVVSDDFADVLGGLTPQEPNNGERGDRRWPWWIESDRHDVVMAKYASYNLRRRKQIKFIAEAGLDVWSQAALDRLVKPRATYTDCDNRRFYGPVRSYGLYHEPDLILAYPNIAGEIEVLKQAAKHAEAWLTDHMDDAKDQRWFANIAKKMVCEGLDPQTSLAGRPVSLLVKCYMRGWQLTEKGLTLFAEEEKEAERQEALRVEVCNKRQRELARREENAAPIRRMMWEFSKLKGKGRPPSEAQVNYASNLYVEAGHSIDTFRQVFSGARFTGKHASHLIDNAHRQPYTPKLVPSDGSIEGQLKHDAVKLARAFPHSHLHPDGQKIQDVHVVDDGGSIYYTCGDDYKLLIWDDGSDGGLLSYDDLSFWSLKLRAAVLLLDEGSLQAA